MKDVGECSDGERLQTHLSSSGVGASPLEEETNSGCTRLYGLVIGTASNSLQAMLGRDRSSMYQWLSEDEAAAEDHAIEVVIVAFSSPAELPALLAKVTQYHDGSEPKPRIVGVGPTSASLGMNGECHLDALVLSPASSSAIACAIEGLDVTHTSPSIDALASIRLFGPDEQVVRKDQLKVLSAAFGAEHIFFQAGTKRLSSLQNIEERKVQEQAGVASALCGNVVIAPLSGESQLVESTGTYLGEFLYANQRRLALIVLCNPGGRHYSERERQLFRSVCERLGHELWSAVRLRKSHQELRRSKVLSVYDPGKGMWSPGALQRVLAMLIGVFGRTGEPVTVAHLDVAGLKRINSRYGHKVGDAVLEHLRTVLVSSFRTTDLVARVDDGGFVCVLQGANRHNARLVLDRIRTRAEESFQSTNAFKTGARLEFASGLAAVSSATEGAAEVLKRARVMVEQSKHPQAAAPKEVVVRAAPMPVLREGALIAGTFRILHEISNGAMGVVYRAQDVSLQRPVAIKILRPSLANDQDFVESFRREAALLASLRHENIVQVFSAGIDVGRPYFVMELVEGQSVEFALKNAIDTRGALSLEQIVLVAQQVGSALDALHKNGLVHRDIKPANILLDPFRNRTVLVDVGIAWRKGSQAQLAGTPGYIAPESFREKVFGSAADIYGLAVTCYEMLTGHLPWPASDDPMELLRRQHDTPPQLLSASISCFKPLDSVIMKGLADDPTERWQSAGEFADAFVSALRGINELNLVQEEPRARGESASTIIGIHSALDGEAHLSRGILFKQCMRVLGPRETDALRSTLETSEPDLARALSRDVEGRAWLPTEHLWQLCEQVLPEGFDAAGFAHDLGQATVRATFRRLFPARGATLSPNRVFAAMTTIWAAYHNWGDVESYATGQSGVFRLQGEAGSAVVAPWVVGMLKQLIVLSGGSEVQVTASEVMQEGARVWTFEAEWLLKRYSGLYASETAGEES